MTIKELKEQLNELNPAHYDDVEVTVCQDGNPMKWSTMSLDADEDGNPQFLLAEGVQLKSDVRSTDIKDHAFGSFVCEW